MIVLLVFAPQHPIVDDYMLESREKQAFFFELTELPHAGKRTFSGPLSRRGLLDTEGCKVGAGVAGERGGEACLALGAASQGGASAPASQAHPPPPLQNKPLPESL